MNPSGVVIVIVGVWAATQVLAGDALRRLGLLPGGDDAAGPAPQYNVDPDTRIPNQDPKKPPLTDKEGRPF